MEYRIAGVLWILLVLLCWEAKADLLHSYHLENRSSTGFEDQIGSANLITYSSTYQSDWGMYLSGVRVSATFTDITANEDISVYMIIYMTRKTIYNPQHFRLYLGNFILRIFYYNNNKFYMHIYGALSRDCGDLLNNLYLGGTQVTSDGWFAFGIIWKQSTTNSHIFTFYWQRLGESVFQEKTIDTASYCKKDFIYTSPAKLSFDFSENAEILREVKIFSHVLTVSELEALITSSEFADLSYDYQSEIHFNYNMLSATWNSSSKNFLEVENSTINTQNTDTGIQCTNANYSIKTLAPININMNHGIYFFLRLDPLPAVGEWIDILKIEQSSTFVHIQFQFVDLNNVTWKIVVPGGELIYTLESTFADLTQYFYFGYSMIPISSTNILLYLQLKQTKYKSQEITLSTSYTLSNAEISIGKFNGQLNKVYFITMGLLNRIYSSIFWHDCYRSNPRKGCPDCGHKKYLNYAGECADCYTRCSECERNPWDCTSCESGYYEFEGSKKGCANVTPIRYYFEDDLYKRCYGLCKRCSGKEYDMCSECEDYAVLLDGHKCLFDCPPAYFAFNGVCIKCDFRCSECKERTEFDCVYCYTDLTGVIQYVDLSNPTPLRHCICGLGYIANIAEGRCNECPPLCVDCDSPLPTDCKVCIDLPTIYKESTTSICKCIDGYYEEDNTCKQCHKSCTKCGSGNKNTNCLPGGCDYQESYYPYKTTDIDNICLLNCEGLESENLFYNNETEECESCHPNCLECYDNTNINCIVCDSSYLITNSRECVHTSCPSGTILQDNGRICISCIQTCHLCKSLPNICVSCPPGRLLQESSCVESCTEEYAQTINSDNTEICSKCAEKCKNCYFTPANISICVECKYGGLYLVNGVCVVSCGQGSYGDKQRGTCLPCNDACLTCTGPSSIQCLQCNIHKGYSEVAENQCSQEICAASQYYNISTYNCQKCHERCKSCKGPGSHECTSCEPKYSLYPALHMCQTCEEFNPGLISISETSNICLEKCGDGRNLQINECDDGNTNNGDGCSKDCKIEQNFKCSGGNITNPDKCLETIQPEYLSFTQKSDTQFIVTFSEPVRFLRKINLTDSYALNIRNKIFDSYDFTFTIPLVNGYITYILIDFKPKSSFQGGEVIELLFTGTRDQMRDKSENYIRTKSITTKMEKYVYIDPGEKEGVGAASKTSLFSLVAALMTAGVLALLFNTPLEGMWGIVNILQLISYLTLINIIFPENLSEFLSYLEIVHNFNSFIPNLFKYVVQDEDNSSFSATFKSRNIPTRNILLLCGSDIESIFIIIIFLTILNCFRLKHRVIWNLNRKFRFNALTRSIIVSYLKFNMAAFLNLGVMGFSNLSQIISSLSTIIILYILLLLPSLISDFFFRNYHKRILCRKKETGVILTNVAARRRRNSRAFNTKYGTLIKEFKFYESLNSLMFYPIFLFYRTLFVIIQITLHEYPQVQLPLLIFLSLIYIVWLMKAKPYKSKLAYFLNVLAQFTYLFCLIIMAIFLSKSLANRIRDILGLTFIVLIVGLIIISWNAFIGYHIITLIKKKMKARREKANSSGQKFHFIQRIREIDFQQIIKALQ